MKFRWLAIGLVYGPHLLAGNIPVYDGGSLTSIGAGVDSVSGKLSGRCLDGSIEDGPANATMSFQTMMTETIDDVLEQERGYGSASVDFWIVGAKAKTEFLIRNTETETQSSILWKFDYRGGTKVFRKRSVNALGLQALSIPSKAGRTCGDSFISGAEMGARFWLAVNLIFENEEKYQYFKTKVSASAMGGLVKKSKTSIKEVQNIAKGAYLSIQYLQYGGESFDLDLINVSLPSVCP
ncbi:MAG: hypothetical protein M3Q07_15650, partial [Pseudobdellovibrionaceae bacterium]|nr:hypothetical protein [Pseudobdellovibrionaceae bacterium]